MALAPPIAKTQIKMSASRTNSSARKHSPAEDVQTAGGLAWDEPVSPFWNFSKIGISRPERTNRLKIEEFGTGEGQEADSIGAPPALSRE